MGNTIKYSETSESNALNKGNWYIGTGDVGKGLSPSTGYWSSLDPPAGGYAIYQPSENVFSVRIAKNDTECIGILKEYGYTGDTIDDALLWSQSQDDILVVNSPFDQIITDGLVLYLNSDYVSSYPRSGSKWYDMAQGISFSSYGTQTLLDVKDNVKCFQFNNSGYWESDSGHENVDMGGDCTLLMWLHSTNIGERDTIFEKRGVQYQSYEHEIAVTWETNERFSWYSRRSTYDYGRTPSIGVTGWYMVGIKMTTGKLSGVNRLGYYSINGGSWTQNYTSRSTNPILPAGAIRIGSGYAGPVESGWINSVLVYDRQLSNNEVNSIYNNTKHRFGL